MDVVTPLDPELQREIYDVTLRRGSPPTIDELAAAVQSPVGAVRSGLERLAARRVIVLQPGSGEILMAPPFSAVPTSFVVHTTAHTSFANCAWDALGVSVMMRARARITSGCGCCGQALAITTTGSAAAASTAVVHFAVPARRWWDDIVFT